MKRDFSIGDRFGTSWPSAQQLQIYWREAISAPTFTEGGLSVDGLHGTANLTSAKDRSNAKLYFSASQRFGVSIVHRSWDGRVKKAKYNYSRGDLTQRLKFVETRDGDKLSLGLFIPIDLGWSAIRDFVLLEGAISIDIPWIRSEDLPPDTFPEPVSPSLQRKARGG